MKKSIVIFLFLLFFSGCYDNNAVDYKYIAFSSLTSQEKSSIINPDYAIIREGNYRYENGIHKIYIEREIGYHFGLTDSNIVLMENQKLISVLFNTTQDALLGPIDVIINPIQKRQ